MTASYARLDPSLPLCWEDENTLRLGFDRAEARFTRPSPAVQRLLSALRSGIPGDRIGRTVRESGATRAEWHEVSERLGSALILDPPTPPIVRPAPRIGLLGGGASSEQLGAALLRAGCRVAPFRSRHPERAEPFDLVIVIERFIEAPHRAGRLLASGLPQLLLRFTDRSMRLGPIVSGRGRPCHTCAILHDSEADPAVPALAAQLLGGAPAAETLASAEFAAVLAIATVLRWWVGGREYDGTRVTVPVRDGLPVAELERDTVRPHPDCGCGIAD
ncbi:hypothetical protein J4H92_04200 [Leucobacter weissii]|uniref:Bacteriocin biosynthesis cyclodehydratase domain-containing protein n=1 Tax=Leucobacter weissii TaxID=1983706 RepID=A0A939SB64_9MICO|nr:hypothetical protein [Leucobacter weissii]MBO1901150.1 hypothetical protein [Leucobacter weissii]